MSGKKKTFIQFIAYPIKSQQWLHSYDREHQTFFPILNPIFELLDVSSH